MQRILMFTMDTCPYCREAHRWMDELLSENPKYAALEIEIVDENEHPEVSDRYDYKFVPTYYVGDKKMHDGVASKEKIRAVFEAAIG